MRPVAAPLEPRAVVVLDTRPVEEPPEVAAAVTQVVRVGFGVVAVALDVLLRSLEGDRHGPGRGDRRSPVVDLADIVVGTAWGAARLSGRVASTGSRLASPVVAVVVRPPGVPAQLQLGNRLGVLAARWRRDRPGTVLDVERVVSAVVDQIDLDLLAAQVLRRLDTDTLATGVLREVDLERLMSDALDQLDLTQVVLDRVDLGRVIASALEQVDLTATVMDNVDLVQVAEYVVTAIDLPEIIRESTGSVASEAVRGLRMQGVDADAAVARAVDRLFFRRANRRAPEETLPSQVADGPDPARDPG